MRRTLLRWMRIASAVCFSGLVRLGAQISPGPLARAHQDLDSPGKCTSCHGLRKEPISQLCLGCHREIAWLVERGRGYHARDAKVGQVSCATCHPDHAGRDFALIAWPKKSASAFNHELTGWALQNSHLRVKCEECHAQSFRVSAAAAFSKRRSGAGWIGLETSCASCHSTDDPHDHTLGTRCDACHDATTWKRAVKFDHATTQYPLSGQHLELSCGKCHRDGGRSGAGAQRQVYRGLSFRECSGCHQDPHGGRFSSRCGECHATGGWNLVNRKEFNHAITRFPLEGKHGRLGCAACHGEQFAKPRPAFGTCATCHADPHEGAATLGGARVDCAACHSQSAFSPATYSVTQHAQAPFALEGRHRELRCGACHVSSINGGRGAVKIRMAFSRCRDCHADAHAGQMSTDPGASDCAACHTPLGWMPSTFAKSAHARLRVALDGRHGELACNACHGASRPGLPPLPSTVTLGQARVLLRPREVECSSCHVNPHESPGGATRSGSSDCRGCHGLGAWRPSTVDVVAHERYSFALQGAHRAVPCAGCHEGMRGAVDGAAVASTLIRSPAGLASLPFAARRARACTDCHESPHGDQFAARPGGQACDACHTMERFTPASRFDHEHDASFSLTGAHRAVACASCHRREPAVSGKPPRVVYRPLSGQCESCHVAKRGDGR